MNARTHLAAVIAAISNWVDAGASDEATVQSVHAARNFLSVPEPAPMEPRAFQQELCQRLVARAAAQDIPLKGAKRNRMFMDSMAGACYALEVMGSDQLNPMLFLATLVAVRGAEVVDHVAQGKPI